MKAMMRQTHQFMLQTQQSMQYPQPSQFAGPQGTSSAAADPHGASPATFQMPYFPMAGFQQQQSFSMAGFHQQSPFQNTGFQ